MYTAPGAGAVVLGSTTTALAVTGFSALPFIWLGLSLVVGGLLFIRASKIRAHGARR